MFCGAVTAGEGVCSECRVSLPVPLNKAVFQVPDLGRCAAPLRYGGAVRKSLLRYKFQGRDHYAAAYADLMAECAALVYSGEFEMVTWVPVSEKRRKKRGYDQSELLAREMCRIWETEPECTLVKSVDIPAQSGFRSPEERRANVLGVYEVKDAEKICGKRILLVDDIVTTGSTLAEAARTLRFAGAEAVLAIAAASAHDGAKM